eukprot:366207-Chlamydomonas_euryale.AAC.8
MHSQAVACSLTCMPCYGTCACGNVHQVTMHAPHRCTCPCRGGHGRSRGLCQPSSRSGRAIAAHGTPRRHTPPPPPPPPGQPSPRHHPASQRRPSSTPRRTTTRSRPAAHRPAEPSLAAPPGGSMSAMGAAFCHVAPANAAESIARLSSTVGRGVVGVWERVGAHTWFCAP